MWVKSLEEVVKWRLCVGCGACVFACRENKIELFDIVDDGIRPFLDPKGCGDCRECIRVCPGLETVHNHVITESGLIAELKEEFGPVLEIWEGYAAAGDIRYQGSSGGVATALAAYCLEEEGMVGVLHTGVNVAKPWKNQAVFSSSRKELIRRAGSRYAPAAPCEGLRAIQESFNPCVFIGKPCDIAGLRKAQLLRPALNDKVGLAIGIFCAGTPSTRGTLDLLKKLGIRAEAVSGIRYRGEGWPGEFDVSLTGEAFPSHKMSYAECWGHLQRYRPYRCYLCPDGTSEFADISCGDAWHREISENEPGRSLILVRTEKGREILRLAREAGYVRLYPTSPGVLDQSQKALLLKRSAIWGRLLAMKLFGCPTPQYTGFHLYENWMELPIKEKVRSVAGTIKRIVQRKYYIPAQSYECKSGTDIS